MNVYILKNKQLVIHAAKLLEEKIEKKIYTQVNMR